MSKEKELVVPDHMVRCIDEKGNVHLIPKKTVNGPHFKNMNLIVQDTSGVSLTEQFRKFEKEGPKTPEQKAQEFEEEISKITDLAILEQLLKKHSKDKVKLATVQARVETIKAEQK